MSARNARSARSVRGRTLPGAAFAACVVGATLAGCLAEPDFESAYAAEIDLCAAEAAPLLASRVADCRARWELDRSCAGVFSFRGSLDFVDVIASSRDLDRTTYTVSDEPAGPTLADVAIAGRAPFFGFILYLDDIGGLVDSGDVDRTISLARPPGGAAPTLDDDRLQFTFLIEDGAASKERQHRTGAVTITRQTADELVGTFEASNSAGDALAGCFHAFVTESRPE